MEQPSIREQIETIYKKYFQLNRKARRFINELVQYIEDENLHRCTGVTEADFIANVKDNLEGYAIISVEEHSDDGLEIAVHTMTHNRVEIFQKEKAAKDRRTRIEKALNGTSNIELLGMNEEEFRNLINPST